MSILPGQMNLTYQTMTRQYSVFPNSENKAGMAVCAWTSNSQQAEAGESLPVSQGSIGRSCFKQQNKTDTEAKAGNGNGIKRMGS